MNTSRLSKFLKNSVITLLLFAVVTAACLLGGCNGGESGSDEPVEFCITYYAEEGGKIDGEATQYVKAGGSTATVAAVAEEGWEFDGWSDGNTSAVRTDRNVQADAEYFAIFIPVLDDGTSGNDGPPNVEPVLPEPTAFQE